MSTNPRFIMSAIQNLTKLCNEMKRVQGKPRHSQRQVYFVRSNQYFRNKLIAWIKGNNLENWSEELQFIRRKKSVLSIQHSRQALTKHAESYIPGDAHASIATEEDSQELFQLTVKNDVIEKPRGYRKC